MPTFSVTTLNFASMKHLLLGKEPGTRKQGKVKRVLDHNLKEAEWSVAFQNSSFGTVYNKR